MSAIFKNQNGDTMRAPSPPDAGWLEISESEYLDICAAKRAAVDPVASIEAKKDAVRKVREQVLDRLAGIAGRASRKGNADLAQACDTASEALLDITRDLPAEPAAVELELFSRYLAIRQAAILAAPSLENAFAQVDA